ncbi:MAG: glycosyltransferase family 4 protein [Candidatus Shapirobacteria bacterium]|nr:glycosyltransferase family 4 protein [Candidatus Shapirobacteria bacterium]
MAKILLITHIYPPAVDGGSTVIFKFGQYLQSKGHTIKVLSSNCLSTDDFTNPSSQHTANGLPVITFLHKPLKFLSKHFPSLKPFTKGPIFPPLSLISFIKYHPDIIIAGPLPTTIIIYAYIFKKITSAKLFICPCYHPNDPDFNNSLLQHILKKADFLWCLTDYEKKLLHHPHTIIKGLGVDSNFLIDSAKIKFPKNPHIVFIGSFSSHKRIELLIAAFNILKIKYPQLSLTLLGQKTLFFPHLIIPSSVNLILHPTRSQIKSAIDNSTLLCLPSIHESFGLVFVESLARGKPVIGADTPQTSEVIKLLNGGLTFKTDNLNSLVSTIDRLIQNPKPLGLSGYKYVKNNLTWDRIGEYLCQKIGL